MPHTAIIAPAYPARDAQDIENRRLVAAVAELVEANLSVADNLASYVEGRLPPLITSGERIQAAVAELCEQYRHERPAGWDEERFLAACGQQLTPQQIDEVHNRPAIDVNTFAGSLHELTNTELPRGRYLIMKNGLNVIKPHQSADTVVSIPEALAALHDIQHVDATEAIKDELSEMDVQRRKHEAQVEEAQAVYDAAVSRGDVVEVERAHRHLIAARYEYLVCHAKRLHYLSSTTEDEEVVHFADNLQKLREDAEDAVKTFADKKNALKDAVDADLERCDEARAREAAEHEAAQANFQQQHADIDANLNALVERKGQLVRELLEKALELRDVMEQQRAVTQEAAEAVKAEAERVTAHDEFVSIGDQHVQRLKGCLDYCDSCEPVVQEMETYVKEMVEKLPEDDAEKALSDIIDHETADFLAVYRAFVFACGELTVKKTHRLDTLERQARLAQHNRDSAMDSLDPNYKRYREELAEVLAQSQAVEGVINALHATQDAGEQVFESVEELVLASCERADTPFVHPLQAFGHESVAARTKFVDRSMKYVAEEEQEVSSKRARLAEAKALAEQEQGALERAVKAAAIGAPPTATAADSAAAAPPQLRA